MQVPKALQSYWNSQCIPNLLSWTCFWIQGTSISKLKDDSVWWVMPDSHKHHHETWKFAIDIRWAWICSLLVLLTQPLGVYCAVKRSTLTQKPKARLQVLKESPTGFQVNLPCKRIKVSVCRFSFAPASKHVTYINISIFSSSGFVWLFFFRDWGWVSLHLSI